MEQKVKLVVVATLAFAFIGSQLGHGLVIDLLIGSTNKELKIDQVDPQKTTVGQLKQMIEKKTSIKAKEQHLISRAGLIRDESVLISKLADFDSKSMHMILAEPLKSEIILNFAKHTDTKSISSAETLGSLKKQFIPEGRVFFERVELMDDKKALIDYQVYDKAHLFVFQKDDDIPIHLAMKDKTFELILVKANTTIDELKKKVSDRTKVAVEKQKLMLNGTELKAGKVIDHCKDPIEGLLIEISP